MMRQLKALAAFIGLAALLAGLPALLAGGIGWPLPDHLPSLDEAWGVLTRPPTDTLLINTVAIVGWLVWAALLRAVAAETWRGLRTGRRPDPEAVHASRSPMRWLATVCLAAIITTGPTALAAGVPEPAPAQAVQIDEHSAITVEADSEAQPQTQTEQTVHTVVHGDTLWDIAETYLGDPLRYPEIFAANERAPQTDGRTLTDPDLIHPGWQLHIPTDTAEPNETTDEEPQTPAEPSDEDLTPTPNSSDEDTGDDETPSPTGPAESDTASMEPPDGDGLIAPGPDTTTGTATQDERSESSPPATSSPAAGATGSGAGGGIWLTTGTFLALTTAVGLLALAKRRRAGNDHKSQHDEPTLTGRLVDLEVLLESEDQATEVPPPAVVDVAATAETPVLAWAQDGIGLTGPGAASAARAAILASVTAQMSVVCTRQVAADLAFDPEARYQHLTVVADAEAALHTAETALDDPVYELVHHQTGQLQQLLILDADSGQDDRLTSQVERTGLSLIVLGPWEGATATIAADGTITSTDNENPVGRCHIADTGTFTGILTATDTTEPPPEPPREGEPKVDLATEPTAPETTPEENDEPDLHLRVLGQPAMTCKGQPIGWRRRRSSLLLTALALEPGGRTLDDLLETVVGDSHVTKARNHLGTIISGTRSNVRNAASYDINVIVHDEHTDRYQLHEAVTVDLHQFTHHRRLAAATEDKSSCRHHLEAALALYGGDLAEGYEDDWLDNPRTQLRKAAYTTCLHLTALYREIDDHQAAIEVLERACAIDRTRPEAWTALAETHTAAGDEAAADKTRRQQRLWIATEHHTAQM